MERDVERLQQKQRCWEETLKIDSRTCLKVKRREKYLSDQVRLVRGIRSGILPQHVFQTDVQDYPPILHVCEENVIIRLDVGISKRLSLPKQHFDEIKKKAQIWLTKLQDLVNIEKKLELEYQSGALKDYVFCVSTGKILSLHRYMQNILLPLTINNYLQTYEEQGDDISEAIYSLSTDQIYVMQRRSAHYDYVVSAEYVQLFLHVDPRLRKDIACIIDGLDYRELADLIHINTLVFYPSPRRTMPLVSLKSLATNCTVVHRTASQQFWQYIDVFSGELFYHDSSLGWMIVQGRVQELNRLSYGYNWKFPKYYLKPYLSPEYAVPFPNMVEINVYSCDWCQLIARSDYRVICVSPILRLQTILKLLRGEAIDINWTNSKCQCQKCYLTIQKIKKNHQTLQCLAATAYKNHFTRLNHPLFAFVPIHIRKEYLAQCPVERQPSEATLWLNSN